MRPHGFFGPQVRLLFSTHRTEQAVDVKEAFSLIVIQFISKSLERGRRELVEIQGSVRNFVCKAG